MTFTPAEQAAMLRALELAATPGVPLGPNPRVGCVLLDDDGSDGRRGLPPRRRQPARRGRRAGPAGERARGATAVVTLEPCNHTGRTGPCARRLVDAGVRRVVFAQADPNPVAAGGGGDRCARPASRSSRACWPTRRARSTGSGRSRSSTAGPFVTWKFATTLDGRSAAADGTSRWVSGRAARLDTHRLRGAVRRDAGRHNTVAVDDPQLTVRDEQDQPLPRDSRCGW